MFWGLNLKPNCKYSQKATKSFHISNAALNVATADNGYNQIYLNYEKQKFLLATLSKNGPVQAILDLNFAVGNEVSFQCVGNGNVTLSGYLIEEEPLDFYDDADDSGEEEEVASDPEEMADLRKKLNEKTGKGNKAAAAVEKKDSKKEKLSILAAEELAESDDDDSDFDVAANEDDEEGDEDEEESDDDDDEEDENGIEDDDDSDVEMEIEEPKKKHLKLDVKSQKSQKQQNGVAADKKDKKNKKDAKKQQQQLQQQQSSSEKKQPQQKAAGGERSLAGGVKIEDLRVGNGPEIKPNKKAAMYYEGRLKSNNKVFDSLKTGAGFKFKVGAGEVIKGWDIGVVGMKVGGKRRIICPPHMGYGARGNPPVIPPNSTLVFDVELKSVN